MQFRKLLFIVFPILLQSACGDSSSNSVGSSVNTLARDLGENWPFTVNTGELKCVLDDGDQVALFVHNGTEYAINGFAQDRDYADVQPILKDNPTFGVKVNVPLTVIRAALQTCS